MIPSEIHSERATLALQKLVETDPAFASLSLWCTHRDAEASHFQQLLRTDDGDYVTINIERKTAAAYTDGRTIYYSSAFNEWTLDEQVGVAAHEILHVALQHSARAHQLAERYGPRYSPLLFNIAADALINESLLQAGFTLPTDRINLEPCLRLIEYEEPPEEALSKLDSEQLFSALLEKMEAKGLRALLRRFPRCPSDLFRGDPLGSEDALLSAEWAQRLSRAMQTGEVAGRGFGRRLSNFGDIPKTTTPWEVILRRMVTKAVSIKPQPEFSQPTKRWLGLDAEARRCGAPPPGFEPGIRQITTKRGRVAVCVDVSGSISLSTLERFGGEIDAIARRTQSEMVLIVFDHGVQLVRELKQGNVRDDLRRLEFTGGGGTSFVEPIAEALTHDASIIVVLTDLMGPFGPAPDRIPVVWASVGTVGHAAPFGKTIYLKR